MVDKNDNLTERLWAAGCYIPVFNLLTCSLASVKMVNSKLCRFHARQGYILFLLWFITIVVALLSQTLSLFLWLVVILLHLYGAFLAFGSKETLIPFLGDFAMKIPEYYVFQFLTGKAPEHDAEVKVVPKAEDTKPEIHAEAPKADDASNPEKKQ